MTQIPVAGLNAELSLGTAKLSSGVAEAVGKLGRLEGQMERTGRKARQTGEDVDRGLAKGLKDAGKSSDVFARRIDALATKFNPLYAASKRYEKEVEALNDALRLGAVSQGIYEQNLERLNAELASGASGFGRATQQAQAFNATAGTMSHQTGNIAAQFQDIGVQLAGGQSPFIIALQQGTQLQGVLAQMGSGVKGVAKALGGAFMSLVSPLSLITIGAVAAGGAIIQAFMASDEETKTFAQSVDDLEASVNRVNQATLDYTVDGLKSLRDKYGEVTTEIVEMMERQEKFAKDLAVTSAKTAVSALGEEVGALNINLEATGRFAFDTQNKISALARGLGISASEARTLVKAMQDARESSDFNDAANAIAIVTDVMQSSAMSGSELVGQLLDAEAALRQLAKATPGESFLSTETKNAADLLRLMEVIDRQSAPVVFDPRDPKYDRGAAMRASHFGFEHGSYSLTDKKNESSGKSEVENIIDDIKRLNDAAKEGITPLEKYRSGLAKLDALKVKGLSDAAYSQEIKRLNEELANSNPMVNDLLDAFGDFVVRGFKDFKGFTQSIIGSFRKMLADMISLALRNQIMIGLGFSGSMAGSVAGAAVGGVGSGMLGGALGGLGGVASGLWSGLSGVFTGGGIGSSFANLGGLISGSVGGLGAIGAALPALGVIGIAIAAFRKKVTQLDSGLRLTTTGMSSLVQVFSKVETKRFFGLIRKTSTSYSTASNDIADPILEAISGLQQGAIDAAKMLGVTSSAFDRFNYQFQLSTKGLSDADAQAALEKALRELGDAFAGLTPGLSSLQNEGEGALAALSRLSTSLSVVNGTFHDLGLRLFDVSVAGGGAAFAFADLLGGVEGFQALTSSYYSEFFTDGERTANLTRQLSAAFADLGLTLPATRSAFRAMLEAADAAGDRDLVASLLKLSPTFAQISDAVTETGISIDNTVDQINQALSDLSPEEFASSLDFNRARGLVASGINPASVSGAAQAALSASTAGESQLIGGMADTLLANINSNIALLWKTVQKFDLDGMPAVRS